MAKVNVTLSIEASVRDALGGEAADEGRSVSNMLERILRGRYELGVAAVLAEREQGSGKNGEGRTAAGTGTPATSGESHGIPADGPAGKAAPRSASAANATRGASKQRGAGTNGKGSAPRAAKRTQMCEHRISPDAYCGKCDA